MSYQSDAHRKFALKYHIFFVCKYRERLLDVKRIGEFMKTGMLRLLDKSDFSIDTMEVDSDHLHMLISSGYIASIIGQVSEETVRKYNENQD